MHIHLIEPFLTGSHQLWAEQLVNLSEHNFELISLPGRHWKWRMQSSAPTLAGRSNKLGIPDMYILTDMVNAAEFRSFLLPERRQIPLVLYMHENQITYPWSPDDDDIVLHRDHTYGMINLKSCMVADAILFNSQYHKSSFLESLPGFLSKFPDSNLLEEITELNSKSTVIPVGVDFPLNSTTVNRKNQPPVILWNHRWEYDKDPDTFFNVLFSIKEQEIDFHLIVCGEHGNQIPQCFREARQILNDQVLHWGYAKSRTEYLSLLKRSDILPVTNRQDFFGISIIEAMGNGVFPLLPNRLAYPEHIPISFHEQHLYSSKESLVEQLKYILDHPTSPSSAVFEHIQQYHVSEVIPRYDQFFAKIK